MPYTKHTYNTIISAASDQQAKIDRLEAEKAELLEACKAAFRFQEAIDMDRLPVSSEPYPTEKLRAAIAKAEPPTTTNP